MHKIAHMTAAILAAAACSAQAADVIDLWPEGAPNKSTITAAEETNAQGSIFNVTRARLEVSAPANPNGKAVIVIPGGGYGNLSMSTIEKSFVPFFHSQGFTTFVLKYRLPKGNPEVPLADANKAVETVRSLFGKYNLHTVGVMGASAGSLGSMLYARAMIENARPVTLHVYESGNHGWGAESSADFPDGDNFRTDLSMWLKKIK